MINARTAPVLIVGSGLAGLMTALTISPQPVLLVTAGSPGLSGSSTLAQGGIAAGIGADDSTALHLADTIAAGDGLCDAAVAAEIIAAGADVVAALEAHGVRFDRKADGSFSLGLEAAHSRHRIVHVDGDATGAGIMRALIAKVLATPSITVMENTRALRLIKQDGRVVGACLENVGPVAARAWFWRPVVSAGFIKQPQHRLAIWGRGCFGGSCGRSACRYGVCAISPDCTCRLCTASAAGQRSGARRRR